MAELTPEQTQAIDDALAAGRMIEAIKLYRDATGQGLKESKEFIDALVPRLIAKDPQRYARLANSSRSGCSVSVSAFLMAVALLAFACRALI